MRTTVDLPDDLIVQTMSVSGKKTKREAIQWALEEALRHQAIEDLVSRKIKIDFAVTPDDLEAREIKVQYGKKRRRGHRYSRTSLRESASNQASPRAAFSSHTSSTSVHSPPTSKG